MKRKELMKKGLLALCLSVCLVSSSVSAVYGEPAGENTLSGEAASGSETGDESGQEVVSVGDELSENFVEIKSAEDFLAFAENCNYDSWSIGKTISLTVDLDLGGLDFGGIAYFNGTFEGNGHEITNMTIDPKGSDYGFFRYIGETGEVKDLNLSGSVTPTGTQKNIGGLVGVNYGTVDHCSFSGAVSGIDSVGGIAGCNKNSGEIRSCSTDAVVMATNYTGGIAGTNEGLVSDCSSKSSVNIEELEPTLDLAGMDVSSFNMTQNVINRNDSGGIAGYSSGVIMDCKNEGTIGYKHTGYNVGGIVGCQRGIVLSSTNEGKVYGRKDVGGIAGQAEPYVESEYLEDTLRQTQEDVKRLSNTLNNISSTLSSTSAAVKQQTQILNDQYADAMSSISGNIGTLTSSVNLSDEAAQGYASDINDALREIENLQSGDGTLTDEQIQQIQDNLGTIQDNLGNMQGAYSGAEQSVEELGNNVASKLQNQNSTENIKNIVNTVDNGLQSMTNSMNSAINQANQITDSISDDMAIMTGDEELVTDISSLETAENMDGVISDCKNYGEIQGDLNVGGIAGTMNVEYDSDPEFDLDMTESLNVTLRSTVNDVMIHCINYGTVTAKKNCAGGITGLQELGFIYDCEGYGQVTSDTGNYLGGIVGKSAGTVEKSYSQCSLSGTDYMGGICGSGYTIKDCISITEIESDGERVGSVAGYLEKEGTVEGNYFVSDEIHGIDGISYAGVADKITYEDVMAMEAIPEGFSRVNIIFQTEDGILAKKEIAYGSQLAETDLPDVPEKDGYYIEWPGLETLTDISENLTVEAEYVPWMESVASSETMENGKSVLLVAGEFYEETELTLQEISGPETLDTETNIAYAYAWQLSCEREKDFETLEAHLCIPEGAERTSVWIKSDNGWTEVEAQTDGSYLVVEIPYGADFAVITLPAEDNGYLVIGGAAVVVILMVSGILWRRRKKAVKPVSKEE